MSVHQSVGPSVGPHYSIDEATDKKTSNRSNLWQILALCLFSSFPIQYLVMIVVIFWRFFLLRAIVILFAFVKVLFIATLIFF